jgi:hypothetical protein
LAVGFKKMTTLCGEEREKKKGLKRKDNGFVFAFSKKKKTLE